MTIVFFLLGILALSNSSQSQNNHTSLPIDNQESRFGGNLQSTMARQIVKKVLSVEQAEGVGARVRRSVGRPEVGI